MFNFTNPTVSALLYLDPGTGSLLFSVIVGIVSTAYFVVKDVLYRARTRAGLLLSPASRAALRAASEAQHAVVFYSDGKQYQGTFLPLLQQMARRGLPCLYLSSDPADPLLALGQQGGHGLLQTECIGSGPMAWARLRTLRARLVCMTTPGLDVLQIRRSAHVQHYMHIVHSPTDKSFNRPYSFDFFDSVLLNGPHQERVLRELESLRGRKRKDLFHIGCVYYDGLAARFAVAQARASAAAASSRQRPLRVLLAPTWGKNGLLTRFGMRLIRALAQGETQVIIRPHPQSARSEPEMLQQLRQESAAMDNCRWDLSDDPVDAMAVADILVSDISGIVFDYAFLSGRPVLTLDFEVDKRGFEAMDLPFEPWEIGSLELLGRRIGLDDLSSLQDIIAQEIGSQGRAEQIRRLRDEYVCNFGHASGPAVELIGKLAGLHPQPDTLIGDYPPAGAPA